MFLRLLLFVNVIQSSILFANSWFLRTNAHSLAPHRHEFVAASSKQVLSFLQENPFSQSVSSARKQSYREDPDSSKQVDDLSKDAEKDAQTHVDKATQGAKDGVPAPVTPSPEVQEEIHEASKSAAELTGVEIDKPGDLATVAFSFGLNSTVVLVCVLVFMLLRKKYPVMYSSNAIEGSAPRQEGFDSLFGWFPASYSLGTQERADVIGLDNALLIEFCTIAMKILGILSVALVPTMPLNFFLGDGTVRPNSIRAFSMANIKDKHPWMYYLDAVLVNFVTIAVIHILYHAMETFMPLRIRWLKSLPAPRCTTVLVEGIPKKWRSDEKLKKFFVKMVRGKHVVEALTVKKAPKLAKLVAKERELKELLEVAKQEWDEDDPEGRPMVRTSTFGPKVDAIGHYELQLEDVHKQVTEERKAMWQQAEAEVGGINCHTAFVTFSDPRHAEIVKQLKIGNNKEYWQVSTPPPPTDIRWEDLKRPRHARAASSMMGYALLTALYFIFIPLCVFGTSLAQSVHLGPLQPLWASFAPGLTLILFLSYLPTVMLCIFRMSFHLRSDTCAQHKLQIWYFTFMIVFVILVTALSVSLSSTLGKLIRRPGRIFSYLARYLPGATKFYIDFMMLQWVTHALNFTRYLNFIKYFVYLRFYNADEAKKMAEPEDQDYYGIGSRSARFSINLVIGIVFSTLSPIIAMLTFINFALCRVFYGYMIVFAEERKADLGGVFFVTQLRNTIVGTLIYNILMIGYLFYKADGHIPMLIAIPSIVYTIHSLWVFHDRFLWETLPFEEVMENEDGSDKKPPHSDGARYIQPEFREEEILL